jgi:CRP-like cAMP-binding protein
VPLPCGTWCRSSACPRENLEVLVAVAEFQTAFDGQLIYVQGHQDGYVDYLIDGTVELLWNGTSVKRLPADSKAARRALDKPGRKRHTVRAVSNCTVVRFPRTESDRQLDEGNLRTGPRQVEVSEIAAEKSSNWMTKMLQSELFERLPATNIQKVFGRMERNAIVADGAIVRQGEPGDYYSVIDRSYCEVSRTIPGGREIHLADLGAGDAFGEAAIIADDARTASVSMLSDGTLIRLSAADFNELIREPLLHGVDAQAALDAVANGTQWVDLSYPEDYARHVLKGSRNVPFNVLRLQAVKLERSGNYIVCGNNPKESAVGAFLLIERGFHADYLDGTVAALFAVHAHAFATGRAGADDPEGGRVVEFPRPSAVEPADVNAQSEGSEMDEPQPEGANLENTIEKIDRLYSQKEWEAEGRARVAVEKYAQTSTGQHLADLIDEIHENHEELPAQESRLADAADGASAFSPHDVFDVAAESGRASATRDSNVLLADTRAPMPIALDEILDDSLFDESDDLAQIVQDFEFRIRDYVENATDKRLKDVEQRYQEKLNRLRKAAAVEVRKRQELARQRYETQYRKKELQLRAHYKKLMALANKISKQKAQLQQAKVQFEEKLSAANAVYRQVEDMRKTLRQQIGALPASPDDVDDDRESA